MMNDLRNETDVPVKLLVDWGHAVFTTLCGGDADMDLWMTVCGSDIAAFHIQQTDGLLDRHCDFTQAGLVTPASLARFWSGHKLAAQTYFLEIIYPFEETDQFVLNDMKAGAALLRTAR